MNEKFIKNAKVEQLTKVDLSHGEEKCLIVKDPYSIKDDYIWLVNNDVLLCMNFSLN